MDSENQKLVENDSTALRVSKQKYATNLDDIAEEQEFWCCRCNEVQQSKIRYNTGVWTFLCCFIWTFLTLFGGLFAFCLDPCKDRTHVCPKCSSYVGRKEFKPFSFLCNWC